MYWKMESDMVGSMDEVHMICDWLFLKFYLWVGGGVTLVEQLFFMLASNPCAVDIE